MVLAIDHPAMNVTGEPDAALKVPANGVPDAHA